MHIFLHLYKLDLSSNYKDDLFSVPVLHKSHAPFSHPMSQNSLWKLRFTILMKNILTWVSDMNSN